MLSSKLVSESIIRKDNNNPSKHLKLINVYIDVWQDRSGLEAGKRATLKTG